MAAKRKVREPVQVYLDASDRQLLEELVARTGLSRAELLRRGIRRMADVILSGEGTGTALNALIGALGDDPNLPPDLAGNHDRYLYGPDPR